MMRKNAVIMIITLLIPLYMLGNIPGDTTIRNVLIQFSYTAEIFPASWHSPAIHAKGEQIDASETERTKRVMAAALSKYPEELLQVSLRAVYFLKTMSMYNVGFGGTNSTDAVYLTNNGAETGYTDFYLEQTLHHEYSSILFRNYPSLLDTIAWKEANIAGFDYNDPEAGVGAIRKNQTSQDIDTALCRVGFLTQYAYSDMENDINTIAQNLFKPSPGFWNVVNEYPRIREKVRILMNFYNRLSRKFTPGFFMKMN